MWKNRVFLLGAAALALLAIVFTLCRKTVTPLPQPAPASTPAPGPLTGVTICVDPGHGGYDGGARGQASGALEKDVNLAVALCLRQELQDAGAQVILISGADGGTGAAPTRIRDNVGIPIELALAAVDSRLREEGIRDNVSIVVGGSIRSSADVVKAIALGADAVYIATAALLALGCHLCRSCQMGRCNWGIATQRPELVKRLNPDVGSQRLINLVTAWEHEIKEMMGGMGINSIEALRGNRVMLRGIGLTEKELEILGVAHAGE